MAPPSWTVPEVLHVDRGAAHVGADDDILQVLGRLDVPLAPDQVFGVGLLQEPAAHIVVGALDRLHHLADLDVVGKSRFGSRSIWYSRTKPPMEATSATPGTVFSW